MENQPSNVVDIKLQQPLLAGTKIDRKFFFQHLKDTGLFASLSQSQVGGMTTILDHWEQKSGLKDSRYLAYMFGTAYKETGRTMQPIREGFAKTTEGAIKAVTALYNKGGIKTNYSLPDKTTGKSYFGRGFVQITWLKNYQAFSKILNIDLVNNPDLALDPAVATEIMFYGMINGTFTTKKLSDYFTADGKSDWKNARRIINGLDCADEIAGYAQKFYQSISVIG